MLLNKGYKKVYLVKVKGIGLHRPYDPSKVVVIESKRKLGGIIDVDPKRVDENIKMGYYDGIRLFKNYDGEKYVFKRKKEYYYKFLNRKVNKDESVDYYKIYSSRKILKYINKNFKKKYFIYEYVSELKLLTGLL